MIPTGIRNAFGQLVFYVVKDHGLPGTTFGVMAGYRHKGRLVPAGQANVTQGGDTAPGFDAVEAAISGNGVPLPEFGYYTGPAAKITGVVPGKTLQAGLAHWSINRQIVIFWFRLGLETDVTKLAAYNATGHRLPRGNSSISHG